MPRFFTTKEVADQYTRDGEVWRVRRLFEDKTLPEPGKFGGKRAIPESMLPAIKEALRARDWLREEVVA